MSTNRFVSRSEAKAAGITKYYDGKLCRKGKHDSERYVSNGACVECCYMANATVKNGAEKELMRDNMKRDITRRAVLSGAEQTTALDAFAKIGSYADAAAALGITIPQFDARRAANDAFDAAMRKLEQQFANGVRSNSTPGFEWTPDNRAQLIDKFIDTGDIAEARDSIGVSPSAYQRELESNPEFSQAIAEAEPKALQHLEERAIQMALNGNDRILQAVLKAKNPSYRDTLRVDVNQTVRNISDEQLRARIAHLQQRLGIGGPVIDAEFTEGAAGLPAASGRGRQAQVAE